MTTLWISARDNLNDRLAEAKDDDQIEYLQFYEMEFSIQIAVLVLQALDRPYKEVHFRRCRGHVDALVAKILSRNMVSRLSFFDCIDLDERAVSAIGTCLKFNTRLTDIRFEEVNPAWADAMARSLGDSLGMNQTLECLLVHEGQFPSESESIRCLAYGLFCSRSTSSLKILHLSNLGLHDESVADIASALIDHSSLQELSFSHNNCSGNAMIAIAALLASSTPLEKLNLSSCCDADNGDDADATLHFSWFLIRGQQALTTKVLNLKKLPYTPFIAVVQTNRGWES